MSRHEILAGAAVALAFFATAACSATRTGSATAAVTMTSSPRQVAPADTQRQLKFPNSVDTVMLEGYDESVHMVRFRLQVFRPGAAGNGHYDNDPADSAVYRLALADQPEIRSAVDICSNGQPTLDPEGLGVLPCTTDQLLDALRAGKKPLARIRVDAADHIVEVSEIYRP